MSHNRDRLSNGSGPYRRSFNSVVRLPVARLSVLLLFLSACGTSDDPDSPSRAVVEPPNLSALTYDFTAGASAEATDTAVRDAVQVAVYCSVVEGAEVPDDFAMFTTEGDAQVRANVVVFVDRANTELAGRSKTARIEAMYGDSWERDIVLSPLDCTR